MPLRLTWRNALAILIAVGAVLTSVALWANGRVAIGLALAEGSQATELMPFPGNEEAILPGVFVVSVTPDGNAARNGIYPGARVSLRARAPRPSNVDRGFPRRTPRPSSR